MGLTLVALFVVAAAGGLILVQHLVPSVQCSQHNDVAGLVYVISGVAYAVLLGLMVVAVWQSWEAADSNSTEGANALAAIFWLTHGLPESEGRHIQKLARSYAREVVDDEWQKMARGEESFKAWAILDEMRGSIQAMETDTNVTNCSTTTRCSGYTNWLTPGRNASCSPTRSFPPSSGQCF